MADLPGTVITVRPLDDSPQVTLGYLSSALGIFLASTSAEGLDEGQTLMLHEALRRLDRVEEEIGG